MGGRLVPNGWSSGTSSSATSLSVTISRIFDRMNSAAVSLAGALPADLRPKDPRRLRLGPPVGEDVGEGAGHAGATPVPHRLERTVAFRGPHLQRRAAAQRAHGELDPEEGLPGPPAVL